MGIRFIEEGAATDSTPTTASKTIRFLDDSQNTQAPQSGFVMGLKDPISGGAQLLEKVLPKSLVDKVNSLNNELAKYGVVSPVGAGGVGEMVQQEEKQYQQQRQAAGEDGFDWGRLAGNVINPANLAPAGGGLLRSAATGAGMAALQPVYSDDFWSSKGIQASTGAILGPALEYGVKGAGALVDKMKGLSSTGQKQALQDWLKELTGQDAKVMQALSGAKEIVKGSKPTAAEAVSDLPQGVQLASAQKAMAKVPTQGAAFEERAAAQQAARQAELAGIAGTPEQVAQVEAQRAATGETRESALAMADTVKQAFDEISSNVMGQANRIIGARGSSMVTGEGIPVTNLTDLAKETTKNLQKYQRVSLADNGFFPLEVKSVTQQIDTAIEGTSSDLSKAVLKIAKDKILSKADENGFISSRDLYDNVRKTLNQDIEAFLTQAGRPAQGGIPQQAAKSAGAVKSFIDASLNKSSGGLWGKYIDDFASHSQKLDRMAIGSALEKKLGTPLDNKERAASFAQAVEEAGGLIKKATGMPRYDNISQALTPSETGAVNRVLADLQRKSKADTLAGKITKPVYEGATPLEGTQFLNRAYTITKEVLGYLARGKRSEFEKKFTELALDPQAMAIFIQSGPITTQRKLVEAMNKYLSPEGQRLLIQSVGVAPMARETGE